MRHGEGKEDARELYCYQQMTFDEIAGRIGRSEKTVRAWADAEGWRQTRAEIINSRGATHEKLHALVSKLADRMIRDCEGEDEISPQSLHALTNLVNAMKNTFTYESKAVAETPAAAEAQATPEDLAAKVAEIMGA